MHTRENLSSTRRDVVVVGASAGGVEALADLVRALPGDFGGCMLVVLHVPPNATSALPDIFRRVGVLPARHATAGDVLEPGVILVAPPDQHLVVYDDAVTLSRGPTENGHRPAVDVLFRTAATVLGSRVTGVVLSGSLDDGAAGLVAVKLRGGLALVQDPGEALHPSMPRAAIRAADVDEVLSVKEIAHRLVEIVREEAPAPPAVSDLMEMEAAMANLDPRAMHGRDRPGRPSGWSCPDCNGTLFEIHEGGLTRFRCRVGHAWSAAGLVAQQSASMDTALWVALRTLEEKAALTGELGARAAERGHRLTAEQFTRLSVEARRAATMVRDLLSRVSGAEQDMAPDEAVGSS
jgi:two-component system chemotaxis response regulator CheB